MNKQLIIIGGGAAGFFAAVNIKEMIPELEVTILEQGKDVLGKVKISGGGRCNVTNECKEPKQLVLNYPRGNRELLGPFYKFNTEDTYNWFEYRGVALKIEEDGRVFPVSDDSQEIVNCLVQNCKDMGVKIFTSTKVMGFKKLKGERWSIKTQNKELVADYLFLATGSSKFIWEQLQHFGIKTVRPVPSLFTFHCKDTRFRDLSGISLNKVVINICGTDIQTEGPMLITHQGLSGPAILKASAWGAVELAHCDYKFEIKIDWLPDVGEKAFIEMAQENIRKKILARNPYIANRLWEQLLKPILKDENITYAQISKKHLALLVHELKNSSFQINGKSTYKEEFVTAGGIDLQEVDFKGFFLKKQPTIYAAGEILNIDGVTGGFNFQAAWTGAFLAAEHLANSLQESQNYFD